MGPRARLGGSQDAGDVLTVEGVGYGCATLAAVVDHNDVGQTLGLTAGQKSDIVEYLKSL